MACYFEYSYYMNRLEFSQEDEKFENFLDKFKEDLPKRNQSYNI